MKNSFLNSFLFIFAVAISTQGRAQEKGYIGISIGPSFPLGDFASTDWDKEDAGGATPGAVFDITFAYKLGGGNFGITAILRGQANPMDVQSMADEIALEEPGISWTVESDGWGVGGLMFGGFGSFAVSEKISFDPRVMIGFVNASSPEITITGSTPIGSIWAKQSSTDASSFAYLLGAGFRFSLGERMALLTNLDYMASNPEFQNVDLTSSIGAREEITWSQEISAINLGLGIALKL
jgi:hypothetical protein